MVTEYVLVYVDVRGCLADNVLLAIKDKPEWQRGKLNLVGGKIEPGESPSQAAIREVKEETGLDVDPAAFGSCVPPPIVCGQILDDNVIVHCLYCTTHDTQLCPSPEETQQVAWHNWTDVKEDPRLIPNLQIIIPLLRDLVRGWTLTGSDGSYTVKVAM